MARDDEVIMAIKGPSGRVMRLFKLWASSKLVKEEQTQHLAIKEFMRREKEWQSLQEQTQ